MMTAKPAEQARTRRAPAAIILTCLRPAIRKIGSKITFFRNLLDEASATGGAPIRYSSAPGTGHALHHKCPPAHHAIISRRRSSGAIYRGTGSGAGCGIACSAGCGRAGEWNSMRRKMQLCCFDTRIDTASPSPGRRYMLTT